MKYRYTFESDYDVDVCCRRIYKPNSIQTECCPYLSFVNERCEGEGVLLNCHCALVPWTDNKPTAKFEIPVNTKWKRCPLSRKRRVGDTDAT